MGAESSIIGTIIQGGSVGVALVALWILYKFITNHQNHTDDLIEKHTISNTNLANAITGLEKTVDNHFSSKT